MSALPPKPDIGQLRCRLRCHRLLRWSQAHRPASGFDHTAVDGEIVKWLERRKRHMRDLFQADGELEPLTAESTKPVAETRTHAGIVKICATLSTCPKKLR